MLYEMIGAVYEVVGLTVIGNDPADVDELYDRAIHVLNAEADLGHTPSGYEWSGAERV